jgi:ATP-dependent DNA ligase
MLCYPFTPERLLKWKPPYILQPKLDGERCRAIIDASGCCTLVSSEENIFRSIPHIKKTIENLHLRSIEFDGELYIHGADFSSIHSIVSRKENMHPDAQYMELHIFDIVTSDIQAVRTTQLLDILAYKHTGRNFGALQIVPSRIVYTLDDIMQAQDEFATAGYEGFVVRDALAPYVRKRSTQMMKFKPRKEDLYEIVGWAEEISIDGVPKNSLGAFICGSDFGMPRLYNWSGKLPDGYFNVGSGSLLTRDAREKLWKERDTLIGKMARVKYQHLTHARGVPRFPVVVDIMNDLCSKFEQREIT